MANFDDQPRGYADKFIRHDPGMLEQMFGTADAAPFWVADMDFQIAEPISDEIRRLADRGRFPYEFASRDVFGAISGWFGRRHGLKLDTENFVQLPGVLTGLALLIRELTSKGDAVLMQTPSFHQFPRIIEGAGCKIAASPLKLDGDRYEMDLEDLAKQFQAPDLTAMILCNPHNPVGRVWTKDELTQLVALADKHDVTIISDEIHADIIFGDHKFTSLIAVDSGRHAALIGSPAKTFGMQSISNGYIYTGNARLKERLKETADALVLGHGNAFTTFATIAAFTKGDEWLDAFLTYVGDTADWIETYLSSDLPGVKMYPLEGTYQVWLDFSGAGLSPETLKDAMRVAKVAFTPGPWFRAQDGAFARVNIASPRQDIKDAFGRIAEAIRQGAT